MSPSRLIPLLTVLLLALPSPAAEKIVGLPCEGCEAVFEGLPAELKSRARIGDARERGEPLLVEGTVRSQDGKARPGVIVYAYQTNAAGVYPPHTQFGGNARRHGMLRGWALTDAEGRYAFETIRPGSYPSTDLPAHIHMHVIERSRCTYYIDDIVFTDDPLLTAAKRRQADTSRGGSGIVTPVRAGDAWRVARDIVLGKGIPGHEACK